MRTANLVTKIVICIVIAATYPALSAPKPITGTVGLVYDLTRKEGEPHDLIVGFKAAVETLKPSGIELSYKLFDSKTNALGTRAAMQALLREAPDFIVAEINSSKAFVAAEMAEAAKRFMLTPMASSPGITEGKRYVFRASYSDNFQGQKLADFVVDSLLQKKAAILWDGGQLYSKTLTQAFKSEFIARGGEIIAEERVSSTASDFSVELKRIAKSGAKTVFVPVYEELAARILNQAGRMDLAIKQFIGGDGWYPRNIFSDLINPKHFPFNLYWVVQFEPNLKDPVVKSTIAQIEKRTGRSIDGAIAVGYDLGMFVGQILKTLGRSPKSQEEILNTLLKMPKVSGLTADFLFRDNHDTDKSIYIHTLSQTESGFFKEIKP